MGPNRIVIWNRARRLEGVTSGTWSDALPLWRGGWPATMARHASTGPVDPLTHLITTNTCGTVAVGEKKDLSGEGALADGDFSHRRDHVCDL